MSSILNAKRSRTTRVAVVLFLATLIVGGIYLAQASASPAAQVSASSLTDAFKDAWQRANQASSYRFTAHIQQTFIPRAAPEMIGEQNQQVDLHLDGEVQQPDRARINLTAESQSGQATPITLIREGDRTFIQKNGELLPAESPDLIIPNATSNFFDYLAAADNVRLSPDRSASSDQQHYTFDLNTARFVDQLMSRFIAAGVERPILPEMYNQLKGTGELWVDAAGLPVRQIMHLNLPRVSDQYDARIHFVLDLRDWGGVAALPKPVPGANGTWMLSNEAASSNASGLLPPSRETIDAALLLLALLVIVAAFSLWYHHHRKVATAFIVFSVCFSLIFSTPLQLLAQSIKDAAPKTSLAEALSLPTPTKSPEQQKLEELLNRYGAGAAPSSATIAKCGDGTLGVDTDQDGLTDQQEACLGTDAYTVDSDGDGLNDGQEVLGFDYAGQHWTGNPLNVDSNTDGTQDSFEWPDPAKINGTADTDHDNVPDLWDTDDDNDNLADAIDLSPLAVTAYSSTFKLQTDAGGFTGTQYIEIEVQPQNQAHLQYSLTALDWPNGDEEGQITDLNNSTDDVRLTPMLEIQTSVSPTLLADKYGYSVRSDGARTTLYVPAQPISDGGAYRAFYGKVAYAPSELGQPIQWTARLVWMVQVQNDSNLCNTTIVSTDGKITYADCTVQTTTEVPHIYRNETFRVTGLKVTKSLGFESAVFGTPQYPNEDHFLFQTVFGMSAIFLQYDRVQNQAPNRTALQELAYRFAQPGTPPDLRFNLPTTVTLVMSDTASAHLDEGLAALNQDTIPKLLNAYYASPTPDKRCRDAAGASFACATLGIATEYTFGSIDLESIVPTNTVQLSTVPMIRQRSLKAILYERAPSGAWTAASLARTIEIVGKRYGDQLATLLAQLRVKHPEATATSVQVAAFLPYTAWWSGTDRPVQFDADSLLEPSITDEQQLLDDILQVALFNTVNLVETVFNLKDVMGGPDFNFDLLSTGKLGSAVGKVNKFFSARNGLARKVLGISNAALLAATLITEIIEVACGSEEDKKCDIDYKALATAETVLRSVKVVGMAVEVVDAFGQLTKTPFSQIGTSFGAKYAKNAMKQMKSASGIIAVVGTVVTIGLAWTQFGLIAANSNGYTIAVRLALADAIASTLWALITLALSFIPFGIGDLIVAILSVIDSLVQAITGGEYDLATGLRKFFYDIKIATNLDGKRTHFIDQGTGLANGAIGVVPGNTFQLHDTFEAAITKTNDGSDGDLNSSYAEGYFAVTGGPNTPVNAVRSPRVCITANGERKCTNDLTAEFKLITYTVNAKLEFNNLIDFHYVFKECTFIVWCHTTNSETTTLPGDQSERDKGKVTVYLDVLPATVDELWNWPVLGNPDRDGDGLTDTAEAKALTNPRNWDTDGDKLSDSHEVNRSQTNPLKSDTDGDGLSDSFEVRIDTDPLNADSDGDGLTDGEEVYHFNGTLWVGGWIVTLPGGLQTRVYSDPLNADNDGDGLFDNAERSNQLSPNAYNVASHLELDAQPLSTLPGSTATAVYERPNTPVTYTLYLIAGQSPITRTLSACFPTLLTNLTVNSVGGNRLPPAISGVCTGGARLDWNFGGANTLQIGEYFTATLTARTNPAATSSISGTVSVSIAAADKTLSDSSRVVLDTDLPGAAFTAPRNGEILRRDPNGTTYIVGGITTEPTSWVEAIEINTGAGYTLTQGINVWAYAWNLPADGTYTLQARSRDHVGYTSVVTSVNVIVDGTPPTATLGLANNVYLRPTVSGTIQLNGTASDNLAGLAFVQISINYQPWQNVLQIPANSSVLNANWNFTWTLPTTADASGSYRVAVRAVDRANNISAAFARKVVVDMLPPTDDLTTNIYLSTPDVRANVPLTLTGRANDLGNAPLPSRPQSLQGTLSSVMSATVWLQYSKVADDDQGVRITWLGDINGDARADLAVGLPASDTGAGRVAVINGRGGNWPVPPNAEAIFDSRSSFVGAANANLGKLVASAGDVNADGFFDILIGDPANDRAFLIFGRGQPLGANLALTGTSPAAMWTVLNVAGLGTLTEATSAGDVNGDGFDDVWLTVNSNNSYLVLGHGPAWYPIVDVGLEAAAVGHSNHATATGVGDVNGDHIDDYTITGLNAVYLFLGRASLAARSAESLDGQAIWAVSSATTNVKVTALGDVNSDGLSDFIFDNGDTPGLVLGRSSGGWGVTQYLSYNPVAAGFIAAPGDVNGDGHDDILLGVPSNQSAYLILGQKPFPASPPIAATLTGVAGAASAPYTAGADLNCDLSSDLLLLPAQTPPVTPLGPQSPFEETSFVPQNQLPVAQTPARAIRPQEQSAAPDITAPDAPTAFQLIVDDDGGPGVDFTSIQDAVAMAQQGFTIVVRPGVYAPFTVFSSFRNFISIAGVDPDAVFVDGGGAQHAIQIQDAAGVQISNLTVRNAQHLIELQGAGTSGETTPIRVTKLDHLVLHSFSANAIYMDRTSTVDVQHSTIASNGGSGAYLYVDPTTPDPAYPNPTWTARANLPFNAGPSAELMSSSQGNVYAYILTATSPTFTQYISATNSWTPRSLPAGITSVPVADSSGYTLVMIVQQGGNYYPAYYVVGSNTWIVETTFGPLPTTPGVGAAMVGESTLARAGYTYILAGGGSSFYRYIPAQGWLTLAAAPFSPGAGAALAWSPQTSAVYALVGGNTPGFYRYNVAANTWTQLPNAPFNVSSGAGLTWSGGLYATAGGSSQAMAYFDEVKNQWRDLGLSTPNAINFGGGLASVYPDLYEMGGGNTANFYRFGPAGMYPPVKAVITGTAIVGPSNAAATTYYNLTHTYLDFDLAVTQTQWVGGGTWTPAVASPLAYDSALFVNPPFNVYRTDPGSALTAGYFTPRGDTYVSAGYCASCSNDGHTWGADAFASIQAAIDSHARRVLILPGVYKEVFHLVSGVQVIGSGAEATIIQVPDGSISPYLVSAEGVAAASLARLTLAGDGSVAGVRVDSGATGVRIARTIIRNTATAIALDGSATDVEIVNNTIVKNTDGIEATNNAGVDVRNTIFAFNTGTAVSYQSGAPTQLHQYNDYFANSADLRIDDIPQAANGFGEITQDPLFADTTANNYRPLADSPTIDAGNPTDPTPPGAGRADMGYSESGQAAFYASGNYCAQCVNDGLEWQVDAFSQIQPALDAAARYLRSIGCSDSTAATEHGFCNTHVTVGVSAGTYNEHVSVPSYVRLTGIDADTTIIDANGSGSTVTFDGVVDAQVSGFSLMNGGYAGVRVMGASNSITITRNLIRNNFDNAIQFEGGASGSVTFNTILNAFVDGVFATGANTWVDVRDNIVTDGNFGWALEANSGGLILSRYNLLYYSTDYGGVTPGEGDITGQDPQLIILPNGGRQLQPTSPAVDAAEPWLGASIIPVGGGKRADLGYKELVATPLTLLFGKLGSNACFAGNSGVAKVEVGVVPVANPNTYITATLPGTWTPAALQTPGQTASYWSKSITPGNGLSRLYTRATDMVGNVETPDYDPISGKFNLYSGAFIGDTQAPTVTLTAPPNNTTFTVAAVYMSGTADDRIGARFSVASVYFLINGTQRINADWVNDGWDGTGPRTFQAVAPLAAGTYTIQAGAQDEAGNTGLSDTHTFTILSPTSPNHVVTFFDPPTSPWTNQPVLRATGAALFSSVQNNVVTLQVNGGPSVNATLDAPFSESTTWWANVTLTPGSNTISARASNDSGTGPVANLILALDTISPTLTTPPSGLVVTQTATLNGTANDVMSGLDSVEVSVDGGYLWLPATVNGANWSFVWNAPLGKQNTSYPLVARARDQAGNVTTQSFVVMVDNVPPSGFEPVRFNIPIGSYLQSAQTLIMTWTTPIDNGGPVTTTAAINQISSTVPVAVMAGNTLAGNLNLDGKWYAHLAAFDLAGNRVSADYGPWYVNTGQLCLNPQRSIQLEGQIDTANGEWLASGMLDDDERPSFSGSPVVRDRQTLYTTWDANAFYFGWRGAWWTLDGTMFAYFDTGVGGTTQPVSATVPASSLPFAADYAVAITGPSQGIFYHFNGSAWQTQAGMTFAQSSLGDTEVRLPISVSGLSDVRMLAFAMSDSRAVWSVFPTTNPLNGAWTDSYHWQPICAVTAPNANQPRGVSVLTGLSSPQSSGTPYAPNTSLQYIVALDNREAKAVANVQVTMTASAGLTYQSVASPAGTVCNACVAGSNQWRLTLPVIPTATTRLITFTGQLAANLSTLPIVTSTLRASSGAIRLNGASLTHLTDGLPPTVTVLYAPPAVLRTGTDALYGLANDGNGIGVAKVEIRPTGASQWQVVTGTSRWQGALNVPNVSTFSIDVRATDRYSQSSPIQVFTFVVDNVGPVVNMALPPFLSGASGNFAQIGGTTSDPFPVGGLVSRVEVQTGSDRAPWFKATGPYSPTQGSQGWNFTWPLPISDGVPIQLRARATDAAGNITVGAWQTTTVDTIAPVITVTHFISNVLLSTYQSPARSGPPVLNGLMTDGGGIDHAWMRVYAPDGAVYTETLTRTGASWSYIPYLRHGEGTYSLSVIATDLAGNTNAYGPYDLKMPKIYLPMMVRNK